MPSNKRIGFSAEARYLYKNWLGRYGGTRFFASKGLFDLIFVDKDLNIRFVQLKYSTKRNPSIPKDELWDISTWIDQNCLRNVPHIWAGYVLWQSRKDPVEVRLN